MSRRPRLLWVGDAVVQTGFARVTHNVVGRLAKTWDVAVLGINYRGDPHPYKHLYDIYPAGINGDLWGINRIKAVIKTFKPDLICVNNDPWIVPPFIDEAKAAGVPITAYMPVDAPNQPASPYLQDLDLAILYTEFGKTELRLAGYTGRTDVIPHGVDTSVYFPMSQAEARREMGLDQHLPPDAFIVGNVNRNQPRKRLDLTMEIWTEWWIRNGQDRRMFLYLHASNRDIGWNLLQLASYYGINKQLIMTNPEVPPEVSIPEARMRAVYSCLDVQMSTTLGEGWGLTTHEGMACGIAQALPDYAALGEWTRNAAFLVPVTAYAVTGQQINTIGGIVDMPSMCTALQTLKDNAAVRKEMAAAALARATDDRFTWTTVAKRFDAAFKNVLRLTSAKPATKPTLVPAEVPS